MGTCMLIIAVVVATHPPTTHITRAGIAAIAMVYLEAASYNLSWGPVAWYVPRYNLVLDSYSSEQKVLS